MNPKVKKIFMWGVVLPFWLGVGYFMLVGVYYAGTNAVKVHVLNASDREVAVSTCGTDVRIAARSNGILETQCVRKPEQLITSANGAVIETVPFPDPGGREQGEYVYNVEALETYNLVDYARRYSKYAVPSQMLGGAEVIGTLRGAKLVPLPDWTKLVLEGQELPGSIKEGNHVVRLERSAATP